MKKIIITTLVLCSCTCNAVTAYSMGFHKDLSIKVIYEIDAEIESQIDSEGSSNKAEESKPNEYKAKLEYDEAFKGLDRKNKLLVDDWDILEESTKTHKIRKNADIRKITLNLYELIIKSLKKNDFMVKEEGPNYILAFKVEKINYDDLSGVPYVNLVNYKLIQNDEVIYQNSFVSEKKNYLFSKGKYTQLLKTKKVANIIVNDLIEKIRL